MNSNSKNLLGNALFGLGAFTTAAGCLGGITTIVDYLNPDLLQRVKDLYLPDNADLALKFLTPITMGLGVASMLKGEKMINQSRVEKAYTNYRFTLACLASGFNPRSVGGDELPDIEVSREASLLLRAHLQHVPEVMHKTHP